MKRRNLIVLVLLAAPLSFATVFPWLAYWIGLGKIEGRSKHATRAAVTSEVVDGLRERLRVSQPIQIDPLSPYSYFLRGVSESAGTRIAWVIARSHNVEHLSDHRYWHLSGAALVFLLTRNWTPPELIAKAVELEKLTASTVAPQ